MAGNPLQLGLQPPFKTGIASATPLPVLYQDRHYRCHKTKDNQEDFLRQDLDVSRLKDVEPLLWLAGMRKAARPLHRQAMMNRNIVVTEQADLHLTWIGTRIYIKPLPNYLLDFDFWRKNICSGDGSLFEDAKGFLLSYAWLVPNESDFQMAMDTNSHPRLLPEGLNYKQWSSFLGEFLENIDDLKNVEQINVRYRFGELRLGRLNGIYRLAWTKFGTKYFIRGYFYGYHDYGTFLESNFTWIVSVFAYVAIVLTAMQVGLATHQLGNNKSFQEASYGFTVFSIVSPLVAMGVITLVMLVLAVDNFTVAAIHERKTKKSEKTTVRQLAMSQNSC